MPVSGSRVGTLSGFWRGGLGGAVGAIAPRAGAGAGLTAVLSKVNAGFLIGGALIQFGDSVVGPEAYLRKGIDECNGAVPDATEKVSSSFVQLSSSNESAVQSYVDSHLP